ncbi:hypothetical Protein YC6258_00903 [Gynuella sunshinyii YC6258]|uniref:Uncharacterized protein n=1 Tax=Gynuella sunshinyii YC6258 TaxID=1445510 RepID=A0A0C5VHW1_9GAMM|nr:hypothetical Protein YC6258_00903 [Gynuella sunshinyii YC6258]
MHALSTHVFDCGQEIVVGMVLSDTRYLSRFLGRICWHKKTGICPFSAIKRFSLQRLSVLYRL